MTHWLSLEGPKDDRFQVIAEHPAQDFIFDPSFLGIQRSRSCVFYPGTLNAGRTVDQKRAFYKAIADGLHERHSLRREACSFVWSKSPKRTGRLATVRHNTRNSRT
jgi:Tautomerase enzyme